MAKSMIDEIFNDIKELVELYSTPHSPGVSVDVAKIQQLSKELKKVEQTIKESEQVKGNLMERGGEHFLAFIKGADEVISEETKKKETLTQKLEALTPKTLLQAQEESMLLKALAVLKQQVDTVKVPTEDEDRFLEHTHKWLKVIETAIDEQSNETITNRVLAVVQATEEFASKFVSLNSQKSVGTSWTDRIDEMRREVESDEKGLGF